MVDEQTLKGMQIKSLIDERNAQIKEMMTPNFYALNNGLLVFQALLILPLI